VRRQFTLIGLVSLGLLTALVFVPLVAAQQADPPQYFPDTGHVVREPFIHYFNSTGGALRYGDPITDDYVDPDTGLLVQYFEKARLEWHPGNPDPYKVQLGLLGDQLGRRDPPILVTQILSTSDPNCQYFAETGHTVCLKFLEYWRGTGGLDMYGYPITEWILENGRIVQYFQRAKMEWSPEKPEGQRIQLAPLGQIYYDFAGLDRSRLKANPTGAALSRNPITTLRARASVLVPVAPRGTLQTGFVYVTDQLGNALDGAAVTLVVHQPQGDQAYTLRPTNSKGATYIEFDSGQADPGTVVSIEFIVAYNGIFARTRTSYLTWYHR
jgi:hypothetical protein